MFLDVLLVQFTSVASASSADNAVHPTPLWNFENLFQRGSSSNILQENPHAVVLAQCDCDIIPVVTRKRDRHSFGDVVLRGRAPLSVDFFAQNVNVTIAAGCLNRFASSKWTNQIF